MKLWYITSFNSKVAQGKILLVKTRTVSLQDGEFKNTLRAETFAGRNFRVFRVFGPFSRKFMPLEISKQQNAKVFSREIIDNFKNAKVFSREKKLFFQANLRPLPEIRCYRKNQRHMDGYY